MKPFKPMLASPADLDTLRYPVWASPKIDGIRAMVRGDRLVSRKLLDIPNKSITASILGKDIPAQVANKLMGHSPFDGLDGELIVGPLTAHDVYNKTSSFVMAPNKTDEPWTFYVFDHHDSALIYSLRSAVARQVVEKAGHPNVKFLPCTEINDRDELDEFEANAIALGYEGIMLRDPSSLYKYGRSTAKEQILLKVKRFVDSEAVVIRVEEEMANMNEAGRDELGRTKRSTAKAGKVGKGTMGALVVQDLTTKVEFNIGTGFTAAHRTEEWKPGDIVTYKSFPIGVKDRPRHPVFKGRRHAVDMGAPA